MSELSEEPTPEEWASATLPKAVDRAATLWPDQPFVRDEGAVLTFEALRMESLRAARALAHAGVEKGARVGIWAPNSARWIVAANAVMRTGAIVASLNFRYTAHEAANILAQVGASHALTMGSTGDRNAAAELVERADTWAGRIVLLEGDEAAATSLDGLRSAENETQTLPGLDANDTADLIFTSGTTGQPKAVMTSHGQILRTFDAWARGITLQPGDRILALPPFSHSFGRAIWVGCLLRGATVIPHADATPAAMFERIARDRVSVWPGAPSMYQMARSAREFENADLSSLRVAVTGGAPVPIELVHQLREEFAFETIVTAYGLTESTGCVTMTLPEDPPEKVATTSGRPFPGLEVRCVEPGGGVMPAGEPGEVCVRGHTVMKGYWNEPERTAETIDEEGWLHTGDVGVLDEHGYLRIMDRLKDMYVLNGFNVYPAEIEGQLYAHPLIDQVAVVGVPDAKVGEVGVAFMVLRDVAAIEDEELRAWCRERLAAYKVPKQFRRVSELPLNASGKVDKIALAAMA